MFVYLSKKVCDLYRNRYYKLIQFDLKIAIPNNTRINCLSWERNQGFIAIGGGEFCI